MLFLLWRKEGGPNVSSIFQQTSFAGCCSFKCVATISIFRSIFHTSARPDPLLVVRFSVYLILNVGVKEWLHFFREGALSVKTKIVLCNTKMSGEDYQIASSGPIDKPITFSLFPSRYHHGRQPFNQLQSSKEIYSFSYSRHWACKRWQDDPLEASLQYDWWPPNLSYREEFGVSSCYLLLRLRLKV